MNQQGYIASHNQLFMADEQTTRTIAYLIFGIMFVAMAWYVSKRAGENRAKMLEDNAPKIAGEDLLEGGAKNPEQFDEPDEDALEEMAELLGEDETED